MGRFLHGVEKLVMVGIEIRENCLSNNMGCNNFTFDIRLLENEFSGLHTLEFSALLTRKV